MYIDGREVNLTAKEFDLLRSCSPLTAARSSAARICWKPSGSMTIWVICAPWMCISARLREKIEKVPSQPEFIFTKWGEGYYFADK